MKLKHYADEVGMNEDLINCYRSVQQKGDGK